MARGLRTGYAAGGGIKTFFRKRPFAKMEALYPQPDRGFIETTYYSAGVPAYNAAGKQDLRFAPVKVGR